MAKPAPTDNSAHAAATEIAPYSNPTTPSASTVAKPAAKVRVPGLIQMHQDKQAITVLTCYDASFAHVMDQHGVDCILVGDSLGNVVQGHDTTLPVSIADMAYHTACVARGAKRALVLADMPFASYQQSPQQAYDNAAKLLAAGAQAVKIEGGADWILETTRFLVARDIPVCAHLGLTPQSVYALGGYKVQGRGVAAELLCQQAHALAQAGAFMIVLEMIPSPLAARLTAELPIPTIGIGAGIDCSGQVLVMHDMLGVSSRAPRFSHNFLADSGSIAQAISTYVQAVRQRTFPSVQHSFSE